jgi:hypothetical protein
MVSAESLVVAVDDPRLGRAAAVRRDGNAECGDGSTHRE